MATFRIGQRVRVVKATINPQFLGKEVIITSGLVKHWERDDLGYWTDTGLWGEPICFEPLIDNGRKVVSWSDCLWQPTKETA